MNGELSLASDMQLGADKMWDNLSESLNSLGEKTLYEYKEPDSFFRLEYEGI